MEIWQENIQTMTISVTSVVKEYRMVKIIIDVQEVLMYVFLVKRIMEYVRTAHFVITININYLQA